MIHLLSTTVGEVLDGVRPADLPVSEADRRAAGARRAPADTRTLAGRAALRLLVCASLGSGRDAAAALPIDRRCATCGAGHGRPRLPGLSLSSSTSGNRVLAAVAGSGAEVGVDVQEIPAELFAGFDEVVLHPADREAHAPAETIAGLRSRVQAWARIEAVLKSTGRGLTADPVSVRSGAPTVPGWARATGESVPEPDRCCRDLSGGNGWCEALAIRGAPEEGLRLWGMRGGELVPAGRDRG